MGNILINILFAICSQQIPFLSEKLSKCMQTPNIFKKLFSQTICIRVNCTSSDINLMIVMIASSNWVQNLSLEVTLRTNIESVNLD